MKYLILTIALSGLIACGANAPETPSDKAQSGIATQKLELSDAYLKPPLPGRNITAGFFKLKNNGADDRLIAASSSISDSVELHTHMMQDGVMKMRQVSGIDLPSGKTIELKSGGLHLMLFDVVMAEGQENAELTLTFEKSEPLTLTVPIGGAQNKSHGSGTEY